MVSHKSNWSIYSSFAKCIILSFDFQIESELVWFNFRGNGTSFLAGKTKQKRIRSSSICDHKVAIVGVEKFRKPTNEYTLPQNTDDIQGVAVY